MAERPTTSASSSTEAAEPVISRRSEHPRGMGNATRRSGQKLSRQRVGEILKTLAWVIPLTILIWIYAEREQQSKETKTIPIEVRTNAPNRVVQLLLPADKNITAELSGPRDQLLSAMDKIRATESDRVIINIDPNLTPGKSHEISTSLIQSSAPFTTYGISVSNLHPVNLTVYVDEIIEGDIPLRVSSSLTNLDGPPLFTPATVHYRAPRREVEKAQRMAAEAGQEFAAVVDLSRRTSLNLPGQHTEKAVPVISPFARDADATISPTAVDVTLNLRPADVEWEYPAMPILVESLPAVTDRFRVELERPVLPNVTLVGPPNIIEAMKDANFTPRPEARLKVLGEDPAGEPIHRMVRYDNLPSGVRVSAKDQQRTIEFRLVSRSGEGN